jgi:hypothetical protein
MSAETTDTFQRSLPQLSGRLLWFYRILWCALAIGAVLASGQASLQSASQPAVIGLRLVKSIVLVCVATILLYRRQRDPVAALLALAFLAWSITSSFDFAANTELAQLLDRGRFFLFALALLLFPDGSWQPGWTRLIAASSSVAFLIGVGEALHLLSTHLFLSLAIPSILAGIASLIARFRKSTNYALKQQLKWVALGLSVGVSLILIARGGAAFAGVSSRGVAMTILWEALFQLGIIVVALGFLVSLLRYRLFDAETVISRSAAYAALTISLVATFGGTEAMIQNLGQLYLGMNIGSISGAMAAAVAAVLLQPLHERITGWAEGRFQPDLAQFKRDMPELLECLSVSASTQELGDAVLRHVTAAIHSTQSALLVNGRVACSNGVALGEARRWSRNTLEVENPLGERSLSDSLFPIRLSLTNAHSDQAIWLLLGPRPDMTLYGREDLDAVRSTFPAVTHALRSVMAREALYAAMDRREKCVRSAIIELSARMGAVETSQRIALDGRPAPAQTVESSAARMSR